MTVKDVLLSPPLAVCVFLLLAYGLHRLGGVLAAEGRDHPGKFQPYACGEDVLPPAGRQPYHDFFQLALMFSMLHLSTLVVSTLPPGSESHRVAVAYLAGIIVSVLALTGRRRGGER